MKALQAAVALVGLVVFSAARGRRYRSSIPK
jgi:hypothetical protein